MDRSPAYLSSIELSGFDRCNTTIEISDKLNQ